VRDISEDEPGDKENKINAGDIVLECFESYATK